MLHAVVITITSITRVREHTYLQNLSVPNSSVSLFLEWHYYAKIIIIKGYKYSMQFFKVSLCLAILYFKFFMWSRS